MYSNVIFMSMYYVQYNVQRSDSNKIPNSTSYPHRQVDAIVTCLLGDRPGTWNFENHLFEKEPHLPEPWFLTLSWAAEQSKINQPTTRNFQVRRLEVYDFIVRLRWGPVASETTRRCSAIGPRHSSEDFFFVLSGLKRYDIRLEIKNIRPMACIFL